jgi:hypothetical protein
MDSFPDKVKTALLRELKANEEIIWANKPFVWRAALPSFSSWLATIMICAVLIPFSLNINVSNSESIVGIIVISFFGLIAIALFLAPFYSLIESKNTCCVITNKRAFNLHVVRKVTVETIPFFQIEHTTKVTHTDGSGDLILCKEYYWDSYDKRREKNIGFFAIPDVNQCEHVLTEVLETFKSERQKTNAQAESKKDEINTVDTPKYWSHPETTSLHASASPQIEKSLDYLYTAFESAEESRRYVLQQKIESKLKSKRDLGQTYSNRDKDFQNRKNANASFSLISFVDNPYYFNIFIGIVFILVVIFML